MGITVFEAIDLEKASTAFTASIASSKEAKKQVEAFTKELGEENLFGIRHYAGGFTIQGFRTDKTAEDLPVGWRLDRKAGGAVPDKRTPEGKAVAEKLSTLTMPDLVFPGFPNRCHIEGWALHPRLEVLGDKAFMVLTREATTEEIAGWDIDATLWVQAKASSYYLAKEAAEEG